MKDLFIVASYTIKEMMKKKAFLVSNLILIIMIVVGFNIPNMLKAFDGDEQEEGTKILIVDSENIFEGALASLNDMELGYEFEIKNEKVEFDEIKQKIEDSEVEDAIVVSKNGEQIKIEYIVEDKTMMDGVPEGCVNALQAVYTNLQISKLGLTQNQIEKLSPNFEFELTQTNEEEVQGNVLAIMLLSIVLFYAIYFCAYQVSASITTEKTSKIMETLVTSTSPRTIVLGKTVGIGVVGLLQVVVLVAVALICANACLPEGTLDSILDLSQVTPFLAIMTIVYFLLGYLVYALLYALTGSTGSKPEDVQSANGPVAIIAVIGFYLSYFTMMSPNSNLNEFAAMFPFSSPFCVPFRIMMGIATPMQIVISLAILIITILVVAQVSIKIYSNAILNYGNKLSFKDIVRMYKQKDN